MSQYSGGTFISSATPVAHDGGESGQVDMKLGFSLSAVCFVTIRAKDTCRNHSDSLIPHHSVSRNRSMGP